MAPDTADFEFSDASLLSNVSTSRHLWSPLALGRHYICHTADTGTAWLPAHLAVLITNTHAIGDYYVI